MKQTISKGEFRDAFFRMGRKDQFSYEGLGALYDWLEEGTANGAEEYELDVIELCCAYTESSIDVALKEYNLKDLDALNDATVVVWTDGKSVLYAQY